MQAKPESPAKGSVEGQRAREGALSEAGPPV